jgi:hypothetical protein
MTATAKADIAESEQAIARMQAEITGLEAAYRKEADAVVAGWEAAAGDLDQLKLTPRRSDVDVHLTALAWAPHWWIDYRDARGRAQTGNIAAYVTSRNNGPCAIVVLHPCRNMLILLRFCQVPETPIEK